jgi:predicted PurR-regulated permease PerM
VLIGSQVAGVLGALAAIPVAGAIQVILRDWLAYRKPSAESGDVPPAPIPGET